ncbi:phosphate acetyltransferase [Anaerosphaera aminiphila DSM 21120]|uniref:Phosphate acetyltransferase n=1 Tax=Anaerosphaera aminiphila DSM 21120 TaxID=1120995 RepID=A0A1M5TKM7_9FIRM|nr:phosphate acetyltransferase [Anaerosphaera aminiphila]SHH51238.1 phosphate acetyltransferase [Anaerosphaera aminiphila DSM 21120]
MNLIESLTEKVKKQMPTIVFPEAEDRRILEAAVKLNSEGTLKPLLIGDLSRVKAAAKEYGLDISELEVINPNGYEEFDMLVEKFVERRKGKVDEESARKILLDENYFGTMLVYTGKAHGMVSGAVHTTGETVRPALQIIKTREGFSRTSGVFVMLKRDEMYIMADCAINIDPDSDALAEIAVLSEETARTFGMDPKVAMLSFSTKGSASHELVDKVRIATEKAKAANPNMKIDGELQFDAAFVSEVAKKKAPDSEVAGSANVFIFPSLEAGNIGYKLVQYFGDFKAVGPILQGLNKPVNDLSRGSSAEEVHDLAIITAAQAIS